MSKIQELLGKILKSRIEREKVAGNLDADKVNLSETLDIFLAGNKITSEQYAEFTEMINPTVTTTATDGTKATA